MPASSPALPRAIGSACHSLHHGSPGFDRSFAEFGLHLRVLALDQVTATFGQCSATQIHRSD